MPFLNILDRALGCIPVVGTVKNTIQCVIYASDGDPSAATGKLVEAGVGLVCDVFTIASLGTLSSASVVGKELGKKAALIGGKEVGKKAGVVLTTQTVARLAVSTPHRYRDHDILRTQGKICVEPSDRTPRRGHHVINNGVNRVFRDMINEFIDGCGVVFGKSYADLRAEGYITDNSSLARSYDHPLPADVMLEIETMVAWPPEGHKHVDINSVAFGRAKQALVHGCLQVLNNIVQSELDNRKGGITDDLHNLSLLIKDINQDSYPPIPGKNGLFVDEDARLWWLAANPGGEILFERCRDRVRDMFSSLASKWKGYKHDSLIYMWAQEIYEIHKKLLNEMLNAQ